MTELEDRLRDRFRRQADQVEDTEPRRLDSVRTLYRRDRRRRGIGAVAAVVVLIGGIGSAAVIVSNQADRDTDSIVAADPSEQAETDLEVVRGFYDGTTVPGGDGPSADGQFQFEPLRPLAALAETDEVAALTGAAESLACAWTSRYVTDDRAPDGLPAVMMRTALPWPLLDKIAGRSDYAERVAAIGDEMSRGRLRATWRTYLRCDDFPGNTNLAPARDREAASGADDGAPPEDDQDSLTTAGDSFIAFARGTGALAHADSVVLYVGNEMVKTLTGGDLDDPAAWSGCPTAGGGYYAARTCPFSATEPLTQYDTRLLRVTTEQPTHPCLGTTSTPSEARAMRFVTITSDGAPDCASYFAVQLFLDGQDRVAVAKVVWAEP